MITPTTPTFDYTLKGKRIRLIYTDDPYTKLRSGDMGTIKYTFDNLNDRNIAIKLDSGSTLSLVEMKYNYEILKEEEEKNEEISY
jgi:hypothetical protein